MESYAGGAFEPMVGDLVNFPGVYPDSVQVIGVVVAVVPGSPTNLVVAQIGVHEPEWGIPATTYSPLTGLEPQPVPNVSVLPGGFGVTVSTVYGQPGNFVLLQRGR